MIGVRRFHGISSSLHRTANERSENARVRVLKVWHSDDNTTITAEFSDDGLMVTVEFEGKRKAVDRNRILGIPKELFDYEKGLKLWLANTAVEMGRAKKGEWAMEVHRLPG